MWYPTYRRYKRSGVRFIHGWGLFKDGLWMGAVKEKYRYSFNYAQGLREKFNSDRLPPVVGFCMLGVPML